jgi:hypothetical protein
MMQEMMQEIGQWFTNLFASFGAGSSTAFGSPALTIALGAVLLLAGRKLYPILLAVVGFGVGWWLISELGLRAGTRFPYEIDQVGLLAGVIAGVICAGLAFFVHRMVLGVVGFLTGALLALWAIQVWGLHFGGVEWLVVLLVGIFAALALRTLFSGALIVLSSLVGASLLAQGLAVTPEYALPTTLGLLLVGVLVQSRGRRSPRQERKKRRRRERRRVEKMLEES